MMASQENKRHEECRLFFLIKNDDPKVWTSSFEWGEEYICGLIMKNEKIVNIEERIPKIKEQRKQKANRRLISFILLFFIMVLIIIYLQTPISKISSLTITGNEHVPTKQLVKLSQIKEGETEFWNLNKDLTADHIKQNKLIKSVSIKKHFPNKVSIAVKEYANIAYLQKGNLYYELLENGTVLPEEVTPSHAGPIFLLIGTIKRS
ncbi:hypothetical protein BsIDN1_27400 [Bacillus safensis]|uniref:POTRA domain-containing protein n=1 Tax=Bacillus safensis TaxID=561879 RepID=A0A5S9M950_BACIA|nr:hypothetical protein BsIDN1_27400 [Bacillus safensis]